MLPFLRSKPTCLKQLPQEKIKNDIIKSEITFQKYNRIQNLKDSLEKVCFGKTCLFTSSESQMLVLVYYLYLSVSIYLSFYLYVFMAL